MKKILIFLLIIAALALSSYFLFFKTSSTEDSTLTVKPTVGTFRSTVRVSGELRAENSIDVRGPMQARSIDIWEMKISNLVEEGSYVKEGDFVAELDKSEIMNKIKDIKLNIQQIETQYVQAQLDSSINLSAARDNLENLKFDLEEKQLQLKQSAYEAPAVIKQVEISYQRAERALKQAEKSYKTKVKKAIADLSIINTDLQKAQQRLDMHMDVLQQFTILAPAEGMVIYDKDWGGRRKVVGSTINAWNPTVAKLPDLSSMESITYVNEVDIQKIQAGQAVEIGLDANPDKRLDGEVVKVANIGEERRGTSSKVFEVIIKVIKKDTTLLPSMTTANEILISEIDDVMTIPLECINTETEADSNVVNYVYVKTTTGPKMKEVVLGEANDISVIIESGITEEDEVYLVTPKVETSKKEKIALDFNAD